MKKEQETQDGSRPGDLFFSRLDANGPAAVDVTVRQALGPGNLLNTALAHSGWHARQEMDKETKHLAACQRLGWTFLPFVMDCYGGIAAQARNLMDG